MNMLSRMGGIKLWVATAGLWISLAASSFAMDAGGLAPDFETSGPNGVVRLSDYRGKLVYLDFWASWCGPCRQSFPWMNDMQTKLQSQDFQVIAVNLDARREDAEKFLVANPAKFTVAFDPKGSTPRLYGVKGMPTSMLIDRDGKVLFKHAGFNDSGRAELEQRIQLALGEKR